MKILLINPPDRQEIFGNNPSFVEENRGFNPPLGLLFLGTVLKKHGFSEVKILDTQVEQMSTREIEVFISDFKPDAVGLTCMTFTVLDVISTCRIIRKTVPSCRIIIGGPHAHLFPEETLLTCHADAVIMGEGEFSFLRLLENLDREDYWSKIPGIVYRFQGKTIYGPFPEPVKNLDILPIPDRTMLPYEKYSSVLSARSPVTTMFTSRGCPYRCSFCDRPHLGKTFRAHCASRVADEMEECQKLGIREILIYDDTFTVDRSRTLEICREYRRRNLDIAWDIRARVNTVDQEVLTELKNSNCQRIHFGVEAGTEKILKVLNKGITLRQAYHAFKLARKTGIETLAYFMIGSPGETEEEIKKTFAFARKINPDYLHLTILTPFPGTEIYRQGLSQKIFPDFWTEFARSPSESFVPRYWDQTISPEKLKELVRTGYRSFYFRPAYLLNRLKKLKSTDELIRKSRAALSLLLWRR